MLSCRDGGGGGGGGGKLSRPVYLAPHQPGYQSKSRVKTSNFGRFFAVSLLQHGLCFAPDMSPG